jgi:hypothetical protein
MRILTAAIAAVIAAGIATPSFAASKKSVRTHMAEMKAKDPQNYTACMALAEQRGFRADTETPSGLMMFIDGCIMGKQH